MGYRSRNSRWKFEEFEAVDDKTDRMQLAIPNRPISSYDILGQLCGCTPQNLGQCARIRRLAPNCKVYQSIFDYAKNSLGNSPAAVKTIYKVERNGEREPFEETFRLLLWHGTSPAAIASIIQNGFRMGTGGWFGGGVYFADRLEMSLGYARLTATGTKLFILAEVAPGRIYKAHHIHTNYTAPPPGFHSVKGMGSYIPDWKGNQHYMGAIMPCGVTVQNKRHPQFDIPFNEYIMYNHDRIMIRFIVECT